MEDAGATIMEDAGAAVDAGTHLSTAMAAAIEPL